MVKMLFFQVVIWSYQGAQYDEIVNMLSQDVFADDLTAANTIMRKIIGEPYATVQQNPQQDQKVILQSNYPIGETILLSKQ